MFLEAINKNLKGLVGANGSAALHQPVLKPKWGKDGKRIPPPMAPLPVHLIPKVLGGEGGQHYKIGDEAAQKKAQLSTFKKIKNKEELEQEAEKQEENAEFLDLLFNDKLSEDTDHQ